MKSDRLKIIEDLFDRAVNLSMAERKALLESECKDDPELLEEVLALLASDDSGKGFIEERVAGGLVHFSETRKGQLNRQAGPYLLTRELGYGGMGTVYLGERSDGQYKGAVAVKLVRPGMDTDFFLERFSRERQALARLQHPNIARLLDSGTTADGVPYIVMERVEGQAINAYCREQNLTVVQILRLYVLVCQAVAHAHQNFVVHRDLKPGNIMVEPSGSPKLLDFGICKLIEDGAGNEMMTSTYLMTPDYASPEQVRGDPITVASDVYSLGAVLYEILTGHLPHVIQKYSPEEVLRAVCETEVIRPSTRVAGSDSSLARQLSGDLDTILLKALQKTPQRRYASVEQFGEDLRRVLDHEPVLARPDTTFYRARKFARRHRAGVSAAVLVTISLSIGLLGYARQAAIAQRQSAEARRLANAMMFDIHDRIRSLQGSLAAREAIVSTGLDYLDRMAANAGGDLDLRRELAAAYHRMGDIQGNVLESYTGDTTAAMDSYRKGLMAIEGVPESKEAGFVQMDLYQSIGRLLESRNETAASLENLDRAIAIGQTLRAAYPDDHEIGRRLASIYSSSATALRRIEQRPRALEASQRSMEIARELISRNPEDGEMRALLADAISGAATAQAGMNRLEEARQNLQESIELWNSLHAQAPANNVYQRNRMLVYSHLGDLLGNPAYANLGDTAGAKEAFRSMLSVANELYRANPGDQSSTIDYGMAMARVAALPLGDPSERLSLYKQAATLLETAYRKDPGNVNLQMNLAAQSVQAGDILLAAGKTEEARRALHAGLALTEGSSRPAGLRIALISSQKLGEIAASRGHTSEALSHANRAVALGERAFAEPDATLPVRLLKATGYAAMGSVMEKLKNPVKARQWRERAAQELRKNENEPAFSNLHREQLDQLETALRK